MISYIKNAFYSSIQFNHFILYSFGIPISGCEDWNFPITFYFFDPLLFLTYLYSRNSINRFKLNEICYFTEYWTGITSLWCHNNKKNSINLENTCDYVTFHPNLRFWEHLFLLSSFVSFFHFQWSLLSLEIMWKQMLWKKNSLSTICYQADAERLKEP